MAGKYNGNPDTRATMITMWVAGASYSDVARKFGCTSQTVKNVVKQYSKFVMKRPSNSMTISNAPVRDARGRKTHPITEKIRAMYSNGISRKDIAEQLRVTPKKVIDALRVRDENGNRIRMRVANEGSAKVASQPVAKPVAKKSAHGSSYLLFHVRKPAPSGSVFLAGNPFRNPSKADPKHMKALTSFGIPSAKATILAQLMDKRVRLSNTTDDYDFTLAVGYREDMKSLVFAYAIPAASEKGTNKEYRKQGNKIASGRLTKALKDELILELATDFPIHRKVQRVLPEYIDRSVRFFKGRDIDHVCVYTHEGKLVFIDAK